MLPNLRVDRRSALKTRSRQAIVAAAAALIDEREGTGFTVDELAQRADVSRRTVFNHFASVQDVVTEVCSGVLSSIVESVVAVRPGDGAGGASIFEELTASLRSADLVTPVAYLTRVLGGEDPGSAPRMHLLVRAFTDLSDRLVAEMLRRHPAADPLTVHLMVGSLTSGLTVLHPYWFAATGGADDDASRRVWADLQDRVIETMRTGYGVPPLRAEPLTPGSGSTC